MCCPSTGDLGGGIKIDSTVETYWPFLQGIVQGHNLFYYELNQIFQAV